MWCLGHEPVDLLLERDSFSNGNSVFKPWVWMIDKTWHLLPVSSYQNLQRGKTSHTSYTCFWIVHLFQYHWTWGVNSIPQQSCSLNHFSVQPQTATGDCHKNAAVLTQVSQVRGHSIWNLRQVVGNCYVFEPMDKIYSRNQMKPVDILVICCYCTRNRCN